MIELLRTEDACRMFAQTDGPTALRADLVRALSISMGTATVRGEGDAQSACAALSGVWNGRKGYVALLVRWIDAPLLQRFSYTEPLTTLETLRAAVDEGIAFAENMGFAMDADEFTELEPELQEQRLRVWNDVRKLECTPVLPGDGVQRPPQGRQVLARISVVSQAGELAGPQARLRAQL